MLTTTFVSNYTYWHYRKAFTELFHVWLNFLWFVVHFFSLPQLTKSLFSPWKRMTEEKQGFNFEALAAYVVVNMLSRLVGAIMRGSVILVGLIALCFTTLVGLIVMIFWFVAPIVVLALFIGGASLIFTEALI